MLIIFLISALHYAGFMPEIVELQKNKYINVRTNILCTFTLSMEL